MQLQKTSHKYKDVEIFIYFFQKFLKENDRKKIYCAAVNQKEVGVIAHTLDFEAKYKCWNLRQCSIKVMGEKPCK